MKTKCGEYWGKEFIVRLEYEMWRREEPTSRFLTADMAIADRRLVDRWRKEVNKKEGKGHLIFDTGERGEICRFMWKWGCSIGKYCYEKGRPSV
jgi:hypothetical protein